MTHEKKVGHVSSVSNLNDPNDECWEDPETGGAGCIRKPGSNCDGGPGPSTDICGE